jgi:hypothetical protein
MLLNPWSKARLYIKKLTVGRWSDNFTLFIETEGSLLFSQQPVTGPNPEADEFNLHNHPISLRYILKFYFHQRFDLPSGDARSTCDEYLGVNQTQICSKNMCCPPPQIKTKNN